MEGAENFPASGPVLFAFNHLSLLDAFLLYFLVPRPAIPFIKVEFSRRPLVNWILTRLSHPIYIDRENADFQAMFRGLTVLRSGGALGIAPEGHISKTGGLRRGHTGVGYLAIKAVVPIVPMALYGQERLFRFWLKLRRAPISVRVGPPIDLPPGKLNGSQFHAYTETVMLTLARMLPPEYRGVYADRVQSEITGAGTLTSGKENPG
ncbi:MAG: 1-acyl-sn-glycerol-3-phosphate acyltransferase [Desulfobacterales bacterium]|nr:1-acyl-sn-glycerol-3-phosphate acyltransferase [Desulfobacterales bacterium]